ncbi:unnamed protein product [Didymodactylos carnosus]|uniref:Uncharacterized protein n=1 Tax=Didymodactylos carnosus TaxID=1234261 RepID=A0A8S3A231_9BILA|nr:unnamed protein product [Didymodactylos carnosus]
MDFVRKQSQKGASAILFKENLFRRQRINKNGSERWVCTVSSCASSIRVEQEDEQGRTTRKRKKHDVDHDIHLGSGRQALLSEEIDLEEYQRLCRHLGYNYLEVFKKTRDTDISTDEDEDSED